MNVLPVRRVVTTRKSMMSPPLLRVLWCFLFLAGVAYQANAEEQINDHANSYCERVRVSNEQPNIDFTNAIARLAKQKKVRIQPGLLNRYPDLVYLVILLDKGQTTLDSLEKLDIDGRINLCRSLEVERLEKMARGVKFG